MSDGIEVALVGYVDSIVENKIAGWAKCGDQCCSVDLLVDGVLVSTTLANRFRGDLAGAVSADGERAFILAVPPVHCDGGRKSIDVRFAGTKVSLTFGQFQFSHSFVYEAPVIVTKPHPKLAPRAKAILSLLRPADVSGGELLRRGRANDGGYVMLNSALDNAVVYSLGINDDVSWDMEMAEMGCHLFQYDHTIDALPEEHPNFHWFKTGIASSSSPDGVFKPIDDLIRVNGHSKRHDLILKMDIEGYEWDVLRVLPQETLMQFSQIVAEFHSFTTIDVDDVYERISAVLRKLNKTHRLIHIHANNCGWLGLIGGVPLPDAFEVTFVRIADHNFEDCRRIFPTALDMPCNPQAPDFYLGPMGQNADPECW